MATLMRAATYAAVFIGFVLVFLPAQVLEWAGARPPASIGAGQVIGIAVMLVGGTIALACVWVFALTGRGTPAPFDPPRRLVVRGPYRWVRNPMYLGAGLALAGAAGYYSSIALFAFAGLFLLVAHLFVLGYEEPTLGRLFGADYEEYCRRVHRWLPRPDRGGPETGGGTEQ